MDTWRPHRAAPRVLEITNRGPARVDLTVSDRYAGHLENGQDSISDPGMGGLVSMG